MALECSICFGDIEQPGALNCGHVFCYDCITACFNLPNPNGKKCPMCNSRQNSIIRLYLDTGASSSRRRDATVETLRRQLAEACDQVESTSTALQSARSERDSFLTRAERYRNERNLVRAQNERLFNDGIARQLEDAQTTSQLKTLQQENDRLKDRAQKSSQAVDSFAVELAEAKEAAGEYWEKHRAVQEQLKLKDREIASQTGVIEELRAQLETKRIQTPERHVEPPDIPFRRLRKPTHSPDFAIALDKEAFGPPVKFFQTGTVPMKRRRLIDTEVKGLQVRDGKTTKAVITGPVRSKRLR